nr:zinc finger protein 316-like [Penaeus vannamei]
MKYRQSHLGFSQRNKRAPVGHKRFCFGMKTFLYEPFSLKCTCGCTCGPSPLEDYKYTLNKKVLILYEYVYFHERCDVQFELRAHGLEILVQGHCMTGEPRGGRIGSDATMVVLLRSLSNLVWRDTDTQMLDGGGVAWNLNCRQARKVHNCTLCSYRTPSRSDIDKHIRTHTGEKPFSCPHCLYQTANKSNLKRHMRTHTAENIHL